MTDTIPTIVLNDRFPAWANYRSRVARQLTDRAVEVRRDKYGLAVGVAVANLYLGQRKLRKKHDEWEAKQNGNGEPERPMTLEQLHRATAEAARAVLALMPDFDELLKELDERAG